MLLASLAALSCSGDRSDAAAPADSASTCCNETADPDSENGDSGSAWFALPEGCEAPDTLPDDPITWVGGYLETQERGDFFVELIDLEIDGTTVFAVGQGGLMAYDVSDPTKPVLSSYTSGPWSRFHRVEVLGDGWLAATHRDNGIGIVDATDPADVHLVWDQREGGLEGMALDGELLYVTSREDGTVRVVDVSTPSSPSLVGASEEGLSTPWELTPVVDGWTYAADNDLGVVPIQVDGKTVSIGSPVALAGPTLHVARDGDHLYASTGSSGVVVLDLSDPAAPTEIATVEVGGSAVMAWADGGWLWVVDHEGVGAWDISDPADPRPRGYEISEQFALAVRAQGTTAWVGDWNWLSAFELDPEAEAGELDPASEELLLPTKGGEVELVITNRGGGELLLSGASASDERVSVLAETDRLAPGVSTTLRVAYEGGETLDASLCLASDDPDGPTREIALAAGDSDYGVGAYAPDFTLTSIDGEPFTLSDHLGDPVFLAFFASW